MKSPLSFLLALSVFLAVVSAYTVHINAPAVITGIDRGALTSISLNITSGTGQVSVNTGFKGGTVGADTVQSAQTAASYAASYLAVSESNYNFNFTIQSNQSNVSGPSAGLALTLLSIAGMEHKQLNSAFTVTGTISPNGTVGQIGGVYDKVQAAKTINAKYILVPYLPHYNYQSLLYYLSQEAYNIPVIEVKNVSQAVPYALGNPSITPMNYSIFVNYYPAGLPPVNITCSTCNNSAFRQLANLTFNFTQSRINGLDPVKFAGIRSQLQSQLAEYALIGSKGYLYSSADLAFISFPTSFMFSNYNASDSISGMDVLNSISALCSSTPAPPQLTNTNYEYVFGGEARHYWAESTLALAYEEMNLSQSSDEVLTAIQTAAPAYSWCLATGEMYKIASQLGGTPMMLSPNATAYAAMQLRSIQKYGLSFLYVNSTAQAYNAGQYGAALYSAEYANIFYNNANLAFTTNSAVIAAVNSSLSAPNGIWPEQFALQAKFYLYEASVANQSLIASQYMNDAYATSLLSQGIGSVNSYVQANLVPAMQQNTTALSSQVTQLQNQLSVVMGTLVILILLIILLIVIMLLHFAAHGKNQQQQPYQPVPPVQRQPPKKATPRRR